MTMDFSRRTNGKGVRDARGSWSARLRGAARALLAAAVLLPALAHAQGAPFACNDDLYQTRAGSGTTGTALLRFPQGLLAAGGTATNVWGAVITPGLNAVGFREQDGFMYGLNTATGLPALYRIGQTTSVLVGTITTTGAQTPALTSTFVPTGGTFDSLGRFYFAGQGAGGIAPQAIYRVDTIPVGTGAMTVAAVFPLSTALVNIGDIAFGPDGNLYGATGTTLAQIRLPATPGTATVTTTTISAVGGIGSAFFSNPGDLYVYDNGSGNLTSIRFEFGIGFPGPVIVGTPVVISGVAPLPASTAASDGASCLLPNTDVSVAVNLPSVLAPGSTVNGTVICTNNGPSAAATVTCSASSPTPGATLTVGTCTPTVPDAALRASAGNNTITCPFTLTVPGTAGGSDTPQTSVTVDGVTSTVTPETNTANNTASTAASIIDAIDEPTTPTVGGVTGGVAHANVLGNDTLGNGSATLGNVTLSQVSTTHANVTLNPATGAVSVAPGTPGGTYTVTYRICANSAPTVCDTATASVTATPEADLRITKTNTPGVNGEVDQAADTVTSGTTRDYTIVVSNDGPSAADGAVVRDPAPTNLTCTTAVCGSVTGGAVCPAATGAALLSALQSPGGVAVPTLPANSSATFTLTCQIP